MGLQCAVAEGAVFCISPAAAGRSLELFCRGGNVFFFSGGEDLFCVIVNNRFHFCHPLSPLVGDILSYRNVQPVKVDCSKYSTFYIKMQVCYTIFMIKIVAGGKKNVAWCAEACAEYEKRLRKPYEISWTFMEEEKLARWLEKWPFERGREFVICCDERGKNISSREYSDLLAQAFMDGLEVVILIGGAYGFSDIVRGKADFVWSFSKLVFPHQLFRAMVVEQIYRAEQIAEGRPYHHE